MLSEDFQGEKLCKIHLGGRIKDVDGLLGIDGGREEIVSYRSFFRKNITNLQKSSTPFIPIIGLTPEILMCPATQNAF